MDKKIRLLGVAILAMSMTTIAQATTDGVYFGLQAGYSQLKNKSKPFTLNSSTGLGATVDPSNGGFGGRLFGGYQLNEYAGGEMGFTYFTPSSYSVKNLSGSTFCTNPSIKVSSVDFVAKGILPLYTSGFGVYAKAGVAFLRQTQSGSLVSSGICGTKNSIATAVRPTGTIGVSYDVSQSFVVDLSYTQIVNRSKTSITPSATLIAFGFSYHIVDKRCGQFLC